MADPILDALDRLIDRLTDRMFDEATPSVTVASWASEARAIRAALAAQPPADASPPAPVAWCSSGDFLAAAEKRQSFKGFREQWHSDCDMALYAAPPPAPATWPELPDYPEEWRTGDPADTEYVCGLRVGYRYVRKKLAVMNPHQQENCQ